MRVRRCKFWNEVLLDAHAAKWGDGRSIPASRLARWLTAAIKARRKQGEDLVGIELWANHKPRRMTVNQGRG